MVTAGGGVEWMFMPNWSLKFEYLYYDLGQATWANSPNSSFQTLEFGGPSSRHHYCHKHLDVDHAAQLATLSAPA